MLNYTTGNIINKIPNKDSKPVLSNVVTTIYMWLLSTGKVASAPCSNDNYLGYIGLNKMYYNYFHLLLLLKMWLLENLKQVAFIIVLLEVP